MARSHLPRARGASGPPRALCITTHSKGQWPQVRKPPVTLLERVSHSQSFLFYPCEAEPRLWLLKINVSSGGQAPWGHCLAGIGGY